MIAAREWCQAAWTGCAVGQQTLAVHARLGVAMSPVTEIRRGAARLLQAYPPGRVSITRPEGTTANRRELRLSMRHQEFDYPSGDEQFRDYKADRGSKSGRSGGGSPG